MSEFKNNIIDFEYSVSRAEEGLWDASLFALVAGKALAAMGSIDADLTAPNMFGNNCV